MNQITACLAAVLALSVSALGQDEPQQFATTSWHGLSGLYLVPTARTFRQGQLSLGYSESKHVEFLGSKRFNDRQVRGVLTYGVTDCVELTGTFYTNILDIADQATPQFGNENFSTVGLKVRVLQEKPGKWYPSVAIGVRDLFDNTRDVGALDKVNNGRKWFLLASKRLKTNQQGRFLDGHLGLTNDEAETAGLVGFELALTPITSFIAEGMWDAPYLNFRGIFHPTLQGRNDVPGRFVYTTGLRFYPDLIRGLAIDLGFLGDGQFEFAFGLSYTTGR